MKLLTVHMGLTAPSPVDVHVEFDEPKQVRMLASNGAYTYAAFSDPGNTNCCGAFQINIPTGLGDFLNTLIAAGRSLNIVILPNRKKYLRSYMPNGAALTIEEQLEYLKKKFDAIFKDLAEMNSMVLDDYSLVIQMRVLDVKFYAARNAYIGEPRAFRTSSGFMAPPRLLPYADAPTVARSPWQPTTPPPRTC